MASELNPIDLKNAPSLPELVDEVRKTNRARVIRADGEDVAVLIPTPKRQHGRRAKPVDETDALFRGIGSGESTIPGGISGKKHEAVLRAKRKHL